MNKLFLTEVATEETSKFAEWLANENGGLTNSVWLLGGIIITILIVGFVCILKKHKEGYR